jgi:inner membrane protein
MVSRLVKQQLDEQHLPSGNYMVTPTALNNFLWYIASQSDTCHYIGYYSVFDKKQPIVFYHVSRRDSLLSNFDQQEVTLLRRFAKEYYCAVRNTDTVVFCDIRFGQIGGWDNTAPFVFRYDLLKGADGATHIKQSAFKSPGPGVVSKLWERIKGN